MVKNPFVTLEQVQEIAKEYPTPFYLYDEKGIRENAKKVQRAFAWNPGFKEYFAVKATPNPFLMKILHEYGCGSDCSSPAELMLAEAAGITGQEIMYSSNDTEPEEFRYANELQSRRSSAMPMSLVPSSILTTLHIFRLWRRCWADCRRR